MSAKGCSFDAIAELSGMSIFTMQAFYHDFSEKFVDERWIVYPTNAFRAADNLAVYSRLGFPGAMGSVDCTHVHCDRCPVLFSNTFSGREKKHTVAYGVTVNHLCRVLYISAGHPGSRNDKTIIKTDKLVMDLKDKKILQDVEYNLYQQQHKVDNVFISSSILHNMNLVHDEPDITWKNPLNWEAAEDEDDSDLHEGRERLRVRGRLVNPDAMLLIMTLEKCL